MSATILIEVHDEDFAWILAGEAHLRSGLRLPADGLADAGVVTHVRRIVDRLHEAGCRSAWMIAAGDEVVGLCSYKSPPADGSAEIGYNIAPSRQHQGHATRAVAAVLALAKNDPLVRFITAQTSEENVASQRVLEANGFERNGTAYDEDGKLILWRAAVKQRLHLVDDEMIARVNALTAGVQVSDDETIPDDITL